MANDLLKFWIFCYGDEGFIQYFPEGVIVEELYEGVESYNSKTHEPFIEHVRMGVLQVSVRLSQVEEVFTILTSYRWNTTPGFIVFDSDYGNISFYNVETLCTAYKKKLGFRGGLAISQALTPEREEEIRMASTAKAGEAVRRDEEVSAMLGFRYPRKKLNYTKELKDELP